MAHTTTRMIAFLPVMSRVFGSKNANQSKAMM